MPPAFRGLQTLGIVDFWAPLAMHEQLVTGETARSFYTRAQLAGLPGDRPHAAGRFSGPRPAGHEGHGEATGGAVPDGKRRAQRGSVPVDGIRARRRQGATTWCAPAACCSQPPDSCCSSRAATSRACCSRARWRDARKSPCACLSARPVAARSASCWPRAACWRCSADLSGILLAYWGRDLLWSFRPSGMRADFLDLSLEPRVLWFTVALSMFTGILFGLIPAIQGSRLDLVSSIKSQTETPPHGSRWTLGLDLRDALVIGQLALSLVALDRRRAVPAQPAGSATAGSGIPHRGPGRHVSSTPARRDTRRSAGCSSIAMSSSASGSCPACSRSPGAKRVPQFSGQAASRRVFPEGRELSAGIAQPVRAVQRRLARLLHDGGYPDSQGTRLHRSRSRRSRAGGDHQRDHCEDVLAGRGSGRQEIQASPEPELLHRGGRGAGRASTDGLGSVTQPHLYYAALQYYTPAMTLAVRTSGDPQPVLPAVRQVIRQLDATMPLPTPRHDDRGAAAAICGPPGWVRCSWPCSDCWP